MINPKSRTIEWITETSRKLGIHDISLAEKTIRAFSLLEALVRSGCPFVFKGGSSLMLHLNTSKRLSIDIDIICQPEISNRCWMTSIRPPYVFVCAECICLMNLHF